MSGASGGHNILHCLLQEAATCSSPCGISRDRANHGPHSASFARADNSRRFPPRSPVIPTTRQCLAHHPSSADNSANFCLDKTGSYFFEGLAVSVSPASYFLEALAVSVSPASYFLEALGSSCFT